MAKQSTSPWVWVGCGCGALAILVVGAVATLGFGVFQFAKDLEADMKDPAKRQESAREILGAEALPPGFQAQVNLKAPFSLFEMVILSDGEPMVEYDEKRRQGQLRSANLGSSAFIYMLMPDVGDTRREFERLLEGGNPNDIDNVNVGFDFRSREIVGHGELEIPPQRLRYVAHRGEYRDAHEDRDGTYAVLLIDCPSSSKVRAAFYWQQRELTDLPEGGDVDLEGTAYEEELREFMEHFNVCG